MRFLCLFLALLGDFAVAKRMLAAGRAAVPTAALAVARCSGVCGCSATYTDGRRFFSLGGPFPVGFPRPGPALSHGHLQQQPGVVMRGLEAPSISTTGAARGLFTNRGFTEEDKKEAQESYDEMIKKLNEFREKIDSKTAVAIRKFQMRLHEQRGQQQIIVRQKEAITALESQLNDILNTQTNLGLLEKPDVALAQELLNRQGGGAVAALNTLLDELNKHPDLKLREVVAQAITGGNPEIRAAILRELCADQGSWRDTPDGQKFLRRLHQNAETWAKLDDLSKDESTVLRRVIDRLYRRYRRDLTVAAFVLTAAAGVFAYSMFSASAPDANHVSNRDPLNFIENITARGLRFTEAQKNSDRFTAENWTGFLDMVWINFVVGFQKALPLVTPNPLLVASQQEGVRVRHLVELDRISGQPVPGTSDAGRAIHALLQDIVEEAVVKSKIESQSEISPFLELRWLANNQIRLLTHRDDADGNAVEGVKKDVQEFVASRFGADAISRGFVEFTMSMRSDGRMLEFLGRIMAQRQKPDAPNAVNQFAGKDHRGVNTLGSSLKKRSGFQAWGEAGFNEGILVQVTAYAPKALLREQVNSHAIDMSNSAFFHGPAEKRELKPKDEQPLGILGLTVQFGGVDPTTRLTFRDLEGMATKVGARMNDERGQQSGGRGLLSSRQELDSKQPAGFFHDLLQSDRARHAQLTAPFSRDHYASRLTFDDVEQTGDFTNTVFVRVGSLELLRNILHYARAQRDSDITPLSASRAELQTMSNAEVGLGQVLNSVSGNATSVELAHVAPTQGCENLLQLGNQCFRSVVVEIRYNNTQVDAEASSGKETRVFHNAAEPLVVSVEARSCSAAHDSQ